MRAIQIVKFTVLPEEYAAAAVEVAVVVCPSLRSRALTVARHYLEVNGFKVCDEGAISTITPSQAHSSLRVRTALKRAEIFGCAVYRPVGDIAEYCQTLSLEPALTVCAAA